MDNRGSVPDRRGDDPKFVAIGQRIDDLTAQHASIAKAVAENTVITKRIEESTSGLVEAWAAISGGLKVLNVLGKVAKWVGIIAGAAAAVWAALHGVSPTP